MNRVFVDTGGFIALSLAEDANHRRADELFKQAEDEHWRLTTTNAVVVETYSTFLARARNGRALALNFVDGLSRSAIRVERVRVPDEKRTSSTPSATRRASSSWRGWA